MITYKNYTLEQDGARFNLYKTVTREVKSKDKEPEVKEVTDTIGYSFTLNVAIERVALDIMLTNGGKDRTLAEYLTELKGVTQDILKSTGVSSTLL